MSDVVKEYGKALYELSVEEDREDAFLSDVLAAGRVFRSESEWVRVLSSPAIPTEERIAMLDTVFGGKCEPYLDSFMKLVVEGGHGEELPMCLAEFVRLYDEAHGIVNAKAVSAIPLTEEQEKALLLRMERHTGKKLRFSYEVDPSLIGGLRVTVDGTRYEGSVKGRLDRLYSKIGGDGPNEGRNRH